MGLLEGCDEWMPLVEKERVADKLIIQINRRPRVAREAGHERAELAFDFVPVRPRHPAPGSFEPASLGELVVDLTRMELPDEDACTSSHGIDVGLKTFIHVNELRHEFRPGGDHARFVGRPHDLVNRRTRATDRCLPASLASTGNRKVVAKGLGDEHGVTNIPIGDHLIDLLSETPRGLVEVVSRQKNRTRGQTAGIPEREQCLDRRGEPPLHVGRPTAGKEIAINRGRHEWEMNGVEMAIELKNAPWSRAVEPSHHSRCLGMSGRGTIDGKPFLHQYRGKRISGPTSSPSRARLRDQTLGNRPQPKAVDVPGQSYHGSSGLIHR